MGLADTIARLGEQIVSGTTDARVIYISKQDMKALLLPSEGDTYPESTGFLVQFGDKAFLEKLFNCEVKGWPK